MKLLLAVVALALIVALVVVSLRCKRRPALEGTVDELWIYNYALIDAEIECVYESLEGE